MYFFAANQLHLLSPLQTLDRNFPLHRRLSIWQFLNIDQFHRAASPGITRPASLVVHRDTSFRINGPASVVGPVCAFKDITIATHFICVVFGDLPSCCRKAFDSPGHQTRARRSAALRPSTNPLQCARRTSECVPARHPPAAH